MRVDTWASGQDQAGGTGRAARPSPVRTWAAGYLSRHHMKKGRRLYSMRYRLHISSLEVCPACTARSCRRGRARRARWQGGQQGGAARAAGQQGAPGTATCCAARPGICCCPARQGPGTAGRAAAGVATPRPYSPPARPSHHAGAVKVAGHGEVVPRQEGGLGLDGVEALRRWEGHPHTVGHRSSALHTPTAPSALASPLAARQWSRCKPPHWPCRAQPVQPGQAANTCPALPAAFADPAQRFARRQRGPQAGCGSGTPPCAGSGRWAGSE